MNPSDQAARSRRIAAIVAVVAFALMVLSTLALVKRTRAYLDANDFVQPLFSDLVLPRFEFAGRPASLTESPDAETVTLTYGQDEVSFPVGVRSTLNDPDTIGKLDFYVRHQDWLRATTFAVPEPDMELQEFVDAVESGDVQQRVVIVTRTPDASEDEGRYAMPNDWGRGEVERAKWRFDFYELRPEGGIEKTTFRFPMGQKQFDRLKASGELTERPSDELRERTWQYDAALKTMPGKRIPRVTFEDSALRRSGWTLPAAAFSGLAFFLGLFFAIKPSRDARWTAEERATEAELAEAEAFRHRNDAPAP